MGKGKEMRWYLQGKIDNKIRFVRNYLKLRNLVNYIKECRQNVKQIVLDQLFVLPSEADKIFVLLLRVCLDGA